MTRAQLNNIDPTHEAYIRLLPDLSLEGVLHYQLEQITERLEEKLVAIGDEIYAPGKWTVATILQHLIDAERIFAYRALRFARKDTTTLPGFDENAYAANAVTPAQSIGALLEELKVLHIGSLLLFSGFSDEQLQREGIAGGKTVSVAALGFIMAGHQQHHFSIIEERYQPLAKGVILPV